MCLSTPKVPEVQPAPPPVANQSPIGEEIVPTLKTADSEMDAERRKKKVKKSGTSSLQTTSGLNIPTSSGLNIS
jgi:hypothetical protein